MLYRRNNPEIGSLQCRTYRKLFVYLMTCRSSIIERCGGAVRVPEAVRRSEPARAFANHKLREKNNSLCNKKRHSCASACVPAVCIILSLVAIFKLISSCAANFRKGIAFVIANHRSVQQCPPFKPQSPFARKYCSAPVVTALISPCCSAQQLLFSWCQCSP